MAAAPGPVAAHPALGLPYALARQMLKDSATACGCCRMDQFWEQEKGMLQLKAAQDRFRLSPPL